VRYKPPDMAVGVTELKRGDVVVESGDPWQVVEIQSHTPSARGASMMVKAKVRNLRTGQMLAKNWRGGDTVDEAEVEYRPSQFLYKQGDEFVFMDLGSYEQIHLDAKLVGDSAGYMLENLEVRAMLFQDRVITLSLPLTVDMTVVDTAPSIRGATAQAQLKPATVETGIQVMVPSYIEAGEKVRVDTRDGRFVERVK
jgi:elongation factor P